MVSFSRRERMVAHDFADTSFWVPVWTNCRSFFDHVHLALTKCCANRRNPSGAMSHDVTLIGWTQAESSSWERMHRAMRTFQYRSYPCGFKEATDVSPFFGIEQRLHNGVGPSGVGMIQFINASPKSTDVSPLTAPPCCSIETACDHVKMLIIMIAQVVRMIFLAMTLFLAMMLLICRDTTVKVT